MNAGSLVLTLKLDSCHHSRYDRLKADIKHPTNIWKIKVFDKQDCRVCSLCLQLFWSEKLCYLFSFLEACAV